MNIYRAIFRKNFIKLGFAVVALSVALAACNNGTTHEHEWGEWEATTTPTCSTEGGETRVCALDETHIETRAVPVDENAHAWGAWMRTKAPTSTQAGEDTRTCAHDPSHKETRSVPATGNGGGNTNGGNDNNGGGNPPPPPPAHVHNFQNWTETTAPTCTTAGVETGTCAADGATSTRTKAAFGHEYQNWTQTTPATCTEAAIETGTCTHDPSHTTTRTGAAALGHTWGAWAISTASSSSIDGERKRTCTRESSHIETAVIPKESGLEINTSGILLSSSGVSGNVEIPEGVTAIASYAMENTNITSVAIPASLTIINGSAFQYSTLAIVNIASNSQLTTIGADAFAGCTSLDSIIIPASVTTIYAQAFENCTSLALVTCAAVTPPTLGNNAFNGTPVAMQIKVPSASVTAYQTATNWSAYSGIISAM